MPNYNKITNFKENCIGNVITVIVTKKLYNQITINFRGAYRNCKFSI